VSDYPADFANEPDKHWYKQAQTLEIQRNAFARYKGTAMQRYKDTNSLDARLNAVQHDDQ